MAEVPPPGPDRGSGRYPAARLLARLMVTNLRAELQYPGSFLMLTAGRILLTGVEFLGIAALFQRFGRIEGWGLAEVALLYAMASVSFALAGIFSMGFDGLGTEIRRGGFDRVLLRPRAAALLVAGGATAPRRAGRLLQGLAVGAWAVATLDLAWGPGDWAFLSAALLGGAALFYALSVAAGTLAFWTTESLEVMNILTYGGVTAAQYPVSIYTGWLRDALVYVLPLAALNYLPALVLLGRPDELGLPAWAPWASPLVGPLMLAASLRLFRFGITRYQSTGS